MGSVRRGRFGRLLSSICCLSALAAPAGAEELSLLSPDGRTQLFFQLDEGRAVYRVLQDGREIVRPSRLGLTFLEGPPLDRDLVLAGSARRELDETWTQPWGETSRIRCHYRELRVDLERAVAPTRRMSLVFRLFDDGLGFRYELPEQEHLVDFVIMDEVTEFALAGGYQAWWIPAMAPDRYEYLHKRSPVAKLGRVHTPLTLERAGGPCLCIHEAALTDYASMTLEHSGDEVLRCQLVPWPGGAKVIGRAPFVSPWRTLQIAADPGGLAISQLVLNLNEPCRLTDTSWIQPRKYVGIWWGMHLGSFSWGSGAKHGATTAHSKRYIDFAAGNGLDAVLIEGWNPGWDGDWWGNGSGFSFTVPHPDFDIEEVCRYAAERGVKIIGHHETGADVANYESQLDGAFAYYRRLGIDAVKTGYVGHKCDGDQWHHGQFMVRHFRTVVEKAAAAGIMLDVHEPIKDTGIRRTWPNMMTREGARGQEYNAWSGDGGNPPEHETILPFTRLLSGPFDFTPGIFDLLFKDCRPGNRVNTTLAKQLALYIVLYSPMQMAADLPENYEGHPAFQFIRDVPCDWDETRVLHGRIGDTATFVRKDRRSDNWYLGSVTDEEGRVLEVSLDFLDADREYEAEVYADGPEAHWRRNPLSLEIRKMPVNRDTVMEIRLAPGGGQAIRFRPLP